MSPAATIVGPPPPAPLVGAIQLDAEGGWSISPSDVTGQLLVEEILNGSGTLATIPDGLSFSGILSLKVTGPPGGEVTIADSTGKVWLAVSSPGLDLPVQRVTQVVQIPALDVANPLTVAASGGAVIAAADIAGYTTIVN